MSDDIIKFPEKDKENSVINYHKLVTDAYLDVIKKALAVAAADPVPGKFCFEITIDTTDFEVSVPPWLRDQFPNNITVIINQQYENLEVHDSYFAVTLFFNGTPVRMDVPFKSVLFFHDAIHGFKTMFSGTSEEVNIKDPLAEKPEGTETKQDNVVSIDDFRKD